MTVSELAKQHPFPWRYMTVGPGRLQVFDASGQEVKLFTLLDFTVAITESLARQGQADKGAA